MPATKIRRKKKPEAEDAEEPKSVYSEGTKKSKKSKKNIVEIDGQLYMLDENGNPSKKIRKKRKPGEDGDDEKRVPRRFKSDSGVPRRGSRVASSSNRESGDGGEREGRDRVRAGQKIRRRAKSVGRGVSADMDDGGPPPRMAMSAPGKARTYIDAKGRKIIIDEGGRKTVFDKNGKRLRKKGEKGKSSLGASSHHASSSRKMTADSSSDDDDFLSGLKDEKSSFKTESNIFDSLWDDGDAPQRKSNNGNASTHDRNGGSRDGPLNTQEDVNESLSSKISEVGKENKELQLQLSVAEEAIENLTEQNKKEKSKNVKAMTEVMQLKADFTEASSELQKLRSKIKDMQQTMEEKDTQIQDLNANAVVKDTGPCKSCRKLEQEIEVMRESLTADRSAFEKTTEQKDERINFLSMEVETLKEELEAMADGSKGGAKNPTLVRLLREKKELDTKYNQEKEVTTIRIEGMQEMIESLEKVNLDLKKQLKSGGGGGGGNDDDSFDGDRSVELNFMAGNVDVGKRQRSGSTPRRASATPSDLNASISDMFSGLMSRK